MKVKLKKDSDKKTVEILKDTTGERFSCVLADKIFALEDEGYTVTAVGKAVQQKLKNMQVAFYRGK